MSGFNPSIGGSLSSNNFFQQINQLRNQQSGGRVTLNDLAEQQLDNSQDLQQTQESEQNSSSESENTGPRGRTVETGRQEDVRTQGDSFIALGSGDDQRFARSASLEVDDQGNVQDGLSGRQLQETTQNEEGETVTQDLQLSDEQQSVDAQATSELEIGGNLSQLTDEGESVQFDGELTNSEGGTETVSFEATRTGENQFELTAQDPQSGENALQATVNFNDEGTVESTEVQENDSGFEGLSFTSEAGDPVQIEGDELDTSNLSLDFGDNTAGVTDENGTSGGQLDSLTVTEDGQLQGSFTNGETRELGEVATATFEDAGAVTELNDGTFASNGASGEANFSNDAQFNTGELETQNSQNTTNVVNELLSEENTQAANNPNRGELLGAALDISV